MKINKINDQLRIADEVELQGCSDDCIEYYGKNRDIIELEKRGGWKADPHKDSASAIREAKRQFGYYCWLQKTPKTCIYW